MRPLQPEVTLETLQLFYSASHGQSWFPLQQGFHSMAVETATLCARWHEEPHLEVRERQELRLRLRLQSQNSKTKNNTKFSSRTLR